MLTKSPALLDRFRTTGSSLSLALGILTLITFWPLIGAQFINYDDPYYVVQNPHVQNGFTAETVSWAFTSKYATNWHPLTWLSHMLDFRLFGLNAGAHHFTNVLFHLLNVELVFLLFTRMTKRVWESAFLAALFAVHPLHVESVAWISERKDVLSTFFGLFALLAYCWFVNRRTPIRYLTVTVFFFFSLMAKPMLVTLPFLFLVLDAWPLRRMNLGKIACATDQQIPCENSTAVVPLRSLVFEKIPWFVLSLISCRITLWAQSEAVLPAAQLPSVVRLSNAAVAYLIYLKKTFVPGHLVVLYPMPHTLSLGAVIVAVSVLGLISWTVLKRFRTQPYLLIGWLWFLGTLVPTIGVVQVGSQSMADRYTYVPLIGLFLALTWFFSDEIIKRAPIQVRVAIACFCVGLLTFETRHQISFWQDSVSLFSHAVTFTKNNSVCLYNLGLSQMETGNLADAEQNLRASVGVNPQIADAQNGLGKVLLLEGHSEEALIHLRSSVDLAPMNPSYAHNLALGLIAAGSFPDAIAQLRKTLSLFPHYLIPHKDLALALWDQNQPAEAREHLARYLQAYPSDAQGHLILGEIFAEQGKGDESKAEYEITKKLNPGIESNLRQAIDGFRTSGNVNGVIKCYRSLLHLDPDDADSYKGLGTYLASLQRYKEASTNFLEVCRLQPEAVNYYNLALTYSLQKERAAAIQSYERAIQLQTNMDSAMNDLAWLLATAPENKLRNGEKAVRLAEQACALKTNEARYLGTLDAAYAEAGRINEAIRAAQRTREVAKASGQEEVVKAADIRLEMYRAGKPFRERQNEN